MAVTALVNLFSCCYRRSSSDDRSAHASAVAQMVDEEESPVVQTAIASAFQTFGLSIWNNKGKIILTAVAATLLVLAIIGGAAWIGGTNIATGKLTFLKTFNALLTKDFTWLPQTMVAVGLGAPLAMGALGGVIKLGLYICAKLCPTHLYSTSNLHETDIKKPDNRLLGMRNTPEMEQAFIREMYYADILYVYSNSKALVLFYPQFTESDNSYFFAADEFASCETLLSKIKKLEVDNRLMYSIATSYSAVEKGINDHQAS